MKNLGSIVTIRARQLLQELESQGYDTRGLKENAGLKPKKAISDHETMPLEKMVSLFEDASNLTGDDILGFKFGQSRDARDMGLLGYITVSSSTVLNLFENAIRYQSIIGSAMRFDVTMLREKGIFQWPGVPMNARQYWEYHTANCVNQLRTATGVAIKPISVGFTHRRHKRHNEISAYLGCDPIWSAERNYLTFSQHDLNLPLKTADTRLSTMLQSTAEQVLEGMSIRPQKALADIREAIFQQMLRGRPTSTGVASALGISDRTLSRRLANQGTDFRKLLDETRQALASEYLANEDLNLRDVAFLLGFSDPSSFSAASRRWTNKTPSELRGRLLKDQKH